MLVTPTRTVRPNAAAESKRDALTTPLKGKKDAQLRKDARKKISQHGALCLFHVSCSRCLLRRRQSEICPREICPPHLSCSQNLICFPSQRGVPKRIGCSRRKFSTGR